MEITGLYYIENYLTEEELSTIKSMINDNKLDLKSISSSYKDSRRVKHYGYYYSYDKSSLISTDSIPSFIKNLIDGRINSYMIKDFNPQDFDQVIVNEYKSGQEMTYHIDNTKFFGSVVLCITIGESIPIKFKSGDVVKSITPKEGSMYILTKDARYKWMHSCRNDSNNTRHSLTFRTANNTFECSKIN